MPSLPSSGAPRWSVLLGLVALVTGIHLWLLLSAPELPAPASSGSMNTPDRVPHDSETEAMANAAVLETPSVPTPMQVSAVRWVAPAAPASPTPTPMAVKTPAPKPRPATVPLAADTAPPDAPPRDETRPADPAPAAPPPVPAVPDPAEITTPKAIVAADADPPPDSPQAPQEQQLASAVAVPSEPEPATVSEPPKRPPAVAPDSVELRYDVRGKAKGLSYRADASLRWQNLGARYDAELEISAFLVGSRVQTSRGHIGPAGLMPERFSDRRRSTEKAAHFDAGSQRIRFSNNAPDAPLHPGAQDRLSVFLQLGALLRAQPHAYPEGSRLPMQVASTGDAEVWQFDIGPLETVDLPAGNISARKLSRGPRRPYDSRVEIWLAPDWQYLPVRIRLTEHDGAYADQLLREPPPLIR